MKEGTTILEDVDEKEDVDKKNDLDINWTKQDVGMAFNVSTLILKKEVNHHLARDYGRTIGRWQGYHPISKYDKSKVECYTCHMMDHYARECHDATNGVKENANLVGD